VAHIALLNIALSACFSRYRGMAWRHDAAGGCNGSLLSAYRGVMARASAISIATHALAIVVAMRVLSVTITRPRRPARLLALAASQHHRRIMDVYTAQRFAAAARGIFMTRMERRLCGDRCHL